MSAKLLAALAVLILALVPAGAYAKESGKHRAPQMSAPAVVVNEGGGALAAPSDDSVLVDPDVSVLADKPPTELPPRPPGDTTPPTTTPPPAGEGSTKAERRRCRTLSRRKQPGERRSAYKRCLEALKQRRKQAKEDRADEEQEAGDDAPAGVDDETESSNEEESGDSED